MMLPAGIIALLLSIIQLTEGAPKDKMAIRNKRLMKRFDQFLEEYQGFIAIHNNDGQFLCDGLLLDKDFVITTAMCVMDKNITEIQLVYRDETASPSQVSIKRSVLRVHVYPNFNTETWTHNIGILTVEPFPSDQLVYIGTTLDTPKADSVCNLIGLSQNSDAALMKCEVKLLDYQYCNETLFSGNLAENQICAVAVHEDSLCTNNRGGALICGNELAGVLSYDSRCPNNSNVGIFTDISHYNEWIDEVFRTVLFTLPQTVQNEEPVTNEPTITEKPTTSVNTGAPVYPAVITNPIVIPYHPSIFGQYDPDSGTDSANKQTPPVINIILNYHIYYVNCNHNNCTREAIINSLS